MRYCAVRIPYVIVERVMLLSVGCCFINMGDCMKTMVVISWLHKYADDKVLTALIMIVLRDLYQSNYDNTTIMHRWYFLGWIKPGHIILYVY